jgi:hypothetical protein
VTQEELESTIPSLRGRDLNQEATIPLANTLNIEVTYSNYRNNRLFQTLSSHAFRNVSSRAKVLKQVFI